MFESWSKISSLLTKSLHVKVWADPLSSLRHMLLKMFYKSISSFVQMDGPLNVLRSFIFKEM